MVQKKSKGIRGFTYKNKSETYLTFEISSSFITKANLGTEYGL